MDNKPELTERQIEVVDLISRGYSNTDIATSLGITPNTVKIHVAKVFKKLSVSNRAEATAIYSQIKQDAAENSDTFEPSPRFQVTVTPFNNHSDTDGKWLDRFLHHLNSWEALDIKVPSKSQNSINIQQGYVIDIGTTEQSAFIFRLRYYAEDQGSFRGIHSIERDIKKLDANMLVDAATLIYRKCIADMLENGHYQNQAERQLLFVINSFYQRDQEQTNKVISTCNHLISKHPNWLIPHAVKSLTLYRQMVNLQIEVQESLFEQVSESAKQAHDINADSAWAQAAFGHYCVVGEQLEIAEKHFESALRINPCFFVAAQMLIQVYSFRDKFQEAIALAEKSITSYSDAGLVSNFYQALSVVKFCAKDFEGCIQSCKSALFYGYSSKEALTMLMVSAYELNGDTVSAKHYLKNISKPSEGSNEVNALLGYVRRVVPEKHFNTFAEGLSRVGLILPKAK